MKRACKVLALVAVIVAYIQVIPVNALAVLALTADEHWSDEASWLASAWPAPRMRLLYGRYLARIGQTETAERALSEGLEWYPADRSARIVLADLYDARGELDAAIEQWSLAEAGDLLVARGYESQRRNDWGEALRWGSRATRVAPKLSDGFLLAANSLSAFGRFAEAEAVLRNALHSRPEDSRLLIALAKALGASERLEEAERLLRESLARVQDRGDEAEIRVQLSLIAQRNNDRAKAIREARIAQALAPTRGEVQTNLGHLYRWAGDVELAVAAYWEAETLSNDHVWKWLAPLQSGEMLLAFGQPQRALNVLCRGMAAAHELRVPEQQLGALQSAIGEARMRSGVLLC